MKFSKDPGGAYYGKWIEVGESTSMSCVLSSFCHELAHFINWKTGKYPVYHDPRREFQRFRDVFPTPESRARYALRAELYTDRQGKKLLKEWFPRIKYMQGYQDTKECYEFLHGYYYY